MLTNLGFLDLSQNELEGELPRQFSNLASLIVLRCHDNLLTGPLPGSWGKLTSLREIRLDTNALSGEIPSEWRSLKRLRKLNLADNDFYNDDERENVKATEWLRENLHHECEVFLGDTSGS